MGWAWLLMVTALLAISSFPFTLCNVCSLVCPRLRKTWCSGEHQLQSAAAAPQNSLPQSLTLGLHQLLVAVFFLKGYRGARTPHRLAVFLCAANKIGRTASTASMSVSQPPCSRTWYQMGW